MNVFISATLTGKSNGVGRPRLVADDADEEVGREERPEQHRLADDEKEDAEQLRVDPRALVRLGRPCARRARGRGRSRRIPLRVSRRAGGCRGTGSSPAGSLVTCSTVQARSAPYAPDQIAAQPVRLVARQRRDDDLVRRVVLDRVHDARERIGVRDVTRHVEAHALELPQRAAQAAASAASAAPSPAPSCGEITVKRCGDSLARRFERLDQPPATDRLVGDHEGVPGRLLVQVDDRRARPGPWRTRGSGPRGRAAASPSARTGGSR